MVLQASDAAKIVAQFRKMQDKKDLLELLNEIKVLIYGKEAEALSLQMLSYFANPEICHKRYTTFFIPKKNGDLRRIDAPVWKLKHILRLMNVLFQAIYSADEAVTGFAPGKSIVDNAAPHSGKTFVFNLDLKDFFHSFDRNRVKMAFFQEPFMMDVRHEKLAFFMASLCTHPLEINGKTQMVLPQGSPTSPVLTNILCRKLDRKLKGLAKKYHAIYTRYADDLTFSSNYNFYRQLSFRDELLRIIEEDQELLINPDKTRIQQSGTRQEATGLTINEKPNVSRAFIGKLRMWLYYWEKYGYDRANYLHYKDHTAEKPLKPSEFPDLQNVLQGKLAFLSMVKGSDDSTYQKLWQRFNALRQKTTFP